MPATATAREQIFKCEICGNVVEILDAGNESLVCCDEPMCLMEASHEDKGAEKHLPVAESTVDGIIVKVGDVPHPMEKEHHIQWIEVVDGDRVVRVYLKPGQDPQAVFAGIPVGVILREFCNVHGLWETTYQP